MRTILPKYKIRLFLLLVWPSDKPICKTQVYCSVKKCLCSQFRKNGWPPPGFFLSLYLLTSLSIYPSCSLYIFNYLSLFPQYLTLVFLYLFIGSATLLSISLSFCLSIYLSFYFMYYLYQTMSFEFLILFTRIERKKELM